MSVVADVERQLAEARCREQEDDVPELRASTMTHVVWAPPEWLAKAHRVLAGLEERHPARTIVLVPAAAAARRGSRRDVVVRDFDVPDGARGALRGRSSSACTARRRAIPGSLVLPLLISDLPAFCRWRGEPPWERGGARRARRGVRPARRRLVRVAAPARRVRASRGALRPRSRSPTSRGVAGFRWRAALAALWPGIRPLERLVRRGARGGRASCSRAGSARASAPPIRLTRRARRGVGRDGRRRAGATPAGPRPSRERAALGRARHGWRATRVYEAAVPRGQPSGRRAASAWRWPFDEIALPPSIRCSPAKSRERARRPPRRSPGPPRGPRPRRRSRRSRRRSRPRRRACGSRSRRSRARATRGREARQRLLEREAEDGVLGAAHGRDVHAVAARVRAAAALRPPAPVERRRGDDARARRARRPRARSASPRRARRASSSACRRSGR